MDTSKTFYANELTIAVNQAEGIMRYTKKAPSFDENGVVIGEVYEEEIKILIPRGMLEDVPVLISKVVNEHNKNVSTTE